MGSNWAAKKKKKKPPPSFKKEKKAVRATVQLNALDTASGLVAQWTRAYGYEP